LLHIEDDNLEDSNVQEDDKTEEDDQLIGFQSFYAASLDLREQMKLKHFTAIGTKEKHDVVASIQNTC
jgi:hypothetical protein